MNEKFEQLELDTRPALKAALESLAHDTIKTAGDMILRCGDGPSAVRNRHEAYGILAEHLAKINGNVKSIQVDTATLLKTLSDPNYNAVEAVSSICNSTAAAAATMIEAAAEMNRTLRDLYDAENSTRDTGLTPMEMLAEETGFQYAEEYDTGDDAGEMED